MKKIILLSVICLYCISMGMARGLSTINPAELRVENRVNPSVIESRKPRMSWINEPLDPYVKNAVQSAYRILVASSKENLDRNIGDMWDTGKVKSDVSYLIDYAGGLLKSGKDYWWKVQVWDGKGKRSGWSETAMFGMGLDCDDWRAEWIGAPWQGETASAKYGQAPVFNKLFEVDTVGLLSAKAFVTGLGYFELELNGTKVGDDLFVPNVTNYGPRPGLDKARLPMKDNYAASSVLYMAYDIKDYLLSGANCLQAIIGNGFFNSHTQWIECYGSPRFICQIRFDYADGRSHEIVTDSTWSVSPSRVVYNDVYGGEMYDANVNLHFKPVTIRKAPEGKMKAHVAPTDRILRTIMPVSMGSDGNGSFTFDFGEEVTGWIRLSGINGAKGDTVTIRYHYDYGQPGHPMESSVYRYVMNGNGREVCVPKFTWYTFSKVTVSGLDEVDSGDVMAEVVGTDVSVDSEFHSSDSLVNKIVEIWQRTQTDNMHGGLPSDCPHRERNAYTGDGQVTSAMVMASYDAAAFYEKWMCDIRDARHDNGYVPNGAPWQPGCGGGVPWGAAISIIPWEYYLNYGDVSVLADNYDGMRQHTDFMTTWLTPEGTMSQQMTLFGKTEPFYWFNLGEWGVRKNLPKEELVHTFYLWMCADITARSAGILGHKDDADKYGTLAMQTKDAFHKKFYDADKRSYGDFGSDVFALTMGVPDSVRPYVVESLRRQIEIDSDSHLNTGIFGTRYLFSVLARNGLADLAYKVMTRRTYPGFGYWIDNGATTMWEFWDGYASHNHPMFGGGLVWLYRDLAGINYDVSRPGYRHVLVRPFLVDGLKKITYAKITPYGKVSSTVTNTDDDKSIELVIPVGATATVYLPGQDKPVEIKQGNYRFVL